MAKVGFLVSQRREVVELAKCLFEELSSMNIFMLPIVTIAELPHSGKISAESFFKKEKISFIAFSEFYKKNALAILELEKPDLIITDNDLMIIDNAFVLSGKKMGIPTLVIRETTSELPAHVNPIWITREVITKLSQLPRLLKKYRFYLSSIAKVNPSSFVNLPALIKSLLVGHKLGIVGKHADYILTNAPEDADLTKRKCSTAKFVRAVGHPRFDRTLVMMEKQGSEIKEAIKRRYRIPSDKKIILFLSTAQIEHGILTLEQKLAIHRQLLATFEAFKDHAFFILKLHPIEKNIFPLTWKHGYDSFIAVTTTDLSELIVASDLVVTWFSTAMIDVVLARKPLIVLNLFDDRKTFHLLPSTVAIVDQGAALEATSQDELTKYLSSFPENHNIYDNLKNKQIDFNLTYFKTIDGKSIGRICQIIQEIIDKKP